MMPLRVLRYVLLIWPLAGFLPLLPSSPFCTGVRAQMVVKEELVVSDPGDSTLLLAKSIAFGPGPHYLFRYDRDTIDYFRTEKATYAWPPTGETGVRPGVLRTYGGRNKDTLAPQYVSAYGLSRVYGPIEGRVVEVETDYGKPGLVFLVERGDSVFYYANGKLVAAESSRIKNFYGGWVEQNRRGEVLFAAKFAGGYRLYHNERLVDTSSRDFYDYALGEDGTVAYSKWDAQRNRYYGVVGERRFWDAGGVRPFTLGDDGGYCFGDVRPEGYWGEEPPEPGQLYINEHVHAGIYAHTPPELRPSGRFDYAYRDSLGMGLHVNGRHYRTSYSKISHLTQDASGNFACYGQRNYYLYRYRNGREEPRALSKYGVRATPLYIAPDGTSVHYYETDDSIYLYRGEQLLLPPVVEAEFATDPYLENFPWTDRCAGETPAGQTSMTYAGGYYVLLGTDLIGPLPPSTEPPGTLPRSARYWLGVRTDRNFYTIRRDAAGAWTARTGTQSPVRLPRYDYLLNDVHLNGNVLNCYAVRDGNFYRITLDPKK